MGDKKEKNFSVRELIASGKGENKGKTGDEEKQQKGLSKFEKLMFGALFVLAVGVIFTLVGPKSDPNKDITTTNAVAVASSTLKEDKTSYDTQLEKRLEEILGRIEGVGDVQVMVTLAGSKTKVLAEETTQSVESTDEKDSTGGTRATNRENTQNKIVMAEGSKPYIIKEEMPEISGVLVVAGGGDDSYVKESIIQSVSSLLDIPVHKVSVFKMHNAK